MVYLLYRFHAKDRWKIVADIYFSQNEVLLQEGLADAVDKDDFKANLVSLKPALIFHCWFEDNRSEIFIECLVFTAREKCFLHIHWKQNIDFKKDTERRRSSEGNGRCDWISRKVVCIYYTEAQRAILGIEKYNLAPEYEHFYVEPVRWAQWLDDRRNQHFNAFMQRRPKTFAYEKPKEAERKPGGTRKNKWRAGLPQPQLFSEIPESQKAQPD